MFPKVLQDAMNRRDEQKRLITKVYTIIMLKLSSYIK